MSNASVNINTRIRRGTNKPHTALRQRIKRQFFTLNRQEFTRRQRFRDTAGNAYAPAETTDTIYRTLLAKRQVDRLRTNDTSGMPPPQLDQEILDSRGTRGRLHGRVLLYARMPADRLIHAVPTGQITFTDPETNELFTGKVNKSLFIGRSKSGYVVLRQVVSWGRLADPSQFPRIKSKRVLGQANKPIKNERRKPETRRDDDDDGQLANETSATKE